MISYKAILYTSTTINLFIKAEMTLTLKTGLFHSDIYLNK